MSIGVTWPVAVPSGEPVMPPTACVATVGVCCWTGCATLKSNRSMLTSQPAASSFWTT